MRSVARLKMGYYPLAAGEGMKLCSLLSFPQIASVVDPCVGQGTALQLVTSGVPVRRYGVELDADRAPGCDFAGYRDDSGQCLRCHREVRVVLTAVPESPYDSEIESVANNRLERLFLDRTYRWLVPKGVWCWSFPSSGCLIVQAF